MSQANNTSSTLSSLNFDNMSAKEAYEYVVSDINYYINEQNIEKFASVIIDSNDSHYALRWMRRFHSHYTEMIPIIINSNKMWLAFDWVNTVPDTTFHHMMFEMVSNNYSRENIDSYYEIMSAWFINN